MAEIHNIRRNRTRLVKGRWNQLMAFPRQHITIEILYGRNSLFGENYHRIYRKKYTKLPYVTRFIGKQILLSGTDACETGP